MGWNAAEWLRRQFGTPTAEEKADAMMPVQDTRIEPGRVYGVAPNKPSMANATMAEYANEMQIANQMNAYAQQRNVKKLLQAQNDFTNQMMNRNQAMAMSPVQSQRTSADPIAAEGVITALRLNGLPKVWLTKFAEAVKQATNGAEHPAFSDWAMVRTLLLMTVPPSSSDLTAINVVMERLQDPKQPGEETSILANIVNEEVDDPVGRAAKAFAIDKLAEKFGAVAPKLNELAEEALYGTTNAVLIVTEKDGVIEARIEKRPKL